MKISERMNSPEVQRLRDILDNAVDGAFTIKVSAGKRVQKDGTTIEYYKDIPVSAHGPKQDELDPRKDAVEFQYDGSKVVMVDGERVILSQGLRPDLINLYRKYAEKEQDIDYVVNDRLLDRNMLAFANALGINVTE